ncbi:metallopeptidase [Hoyosella rhizosphaerae]|uniref:Peptidase n=1 Tax=Hoyosella rhizosphaerae TaxID=1755582 RepID=A0A916TXY4_9ACTN|nr:metallopeptidase [Hoyosella rhizosphaerae]MBN4927374.1 metallopeptidase [Hoyosella rhizosphaerae]GGC51770.1 peptidase [Hoyosella rhizosphaerae]
MKTKLAAATLCICFAATSCTSGANDPPLLDPEYVAGMPPSDGPSGLREAVDPPHVLVIGGTGDIHDTLAGHAITDLQRYWSEHYHHVSPDSFSPVTTLRSWDSTAEVTEFCGVPTSAIGGAAYCPSSHEIGWDRGALLPFVATEFGDMAIPLILAHEYGHAITTSARLLDFAAQAPFMWEQQADCFSGAYMRDVVHDNSPRFTLNTTTGLDGVLAALLAVHDVDVTSPESGHGSGFDRLAAFRDGLEGGPAQCAELSAEQLEERRVNLPTTFAHALDRGELPITHGTIELVTNSVLEKYPHPHPPGVVYNGGQPCGDGTHTPPVTYCADGHTMHIDLSELASMSTAPQPNSLFAAEVRGDFSAFSLVASRFILGIHAADHHAPDHHAADERPLEGMDAALAITCLTGAWAAAAAREDVGRIYLSPGDIDEALGVILQHPTFTSDVTGVSVPSGLARTSAFSTGFSRGQAHCELPG